MCPASLPAAPRAISMHFTFVSCMRPQEHRIFFPIYRLMSILICCVTVHSSVFTLYLQNSRRTLPENVPLLYSFKENCVNLYVLSTWQQKRIIHDYFVHFLFFYDML